MIITLHPHTSRRRVHVVIDGLDPAQAWDVEIREHKSKRSLAQNRLLWSWHAEVQRHLGESTGTWHAVEDIHEYIVRSLLPLRTVEIGGKAMRMRASTSRLRVAQFTDFLRRYEEHARDRWGVQFPHPENLYYESIGA